jgi:two-component system, NtrC family, sensor kinase
MPQRRRQTLNLLRLAMFGAIAAPIALFGYASWNQYRESKRAADERIERNLDVLSEHAKKVFQSIEIGLLTIDEIIEGLSDTLIVSHQRELHERLKRIGDILPEIQGIWVYDNKGRALVSGRVFPVPDSDFSDREYFSAHVEKEIHTYVADFQLPRTVAGDPFFSVSRRRKSTDNSFTGVIAFSLVSKDISNFYEQVGLRTDGAYFALLRADGSFLARFPGPLEKPVRLTPQTGFHITIAKTPEGGIYDTGSIIDGIDRRIGTRRIPNYPVYVSAGVEQQAIRSEWIQAMAAHLIFGFPATLLLVGMIGLALRRTNNLYAEIDRREQAESALRQAQRMEAVGNLTGGIAHDFNNLLMVILGNLEIAKKQLDNWTDTSRTRLERAVGNATQGAQRAATLTQRLLAFSRRQPLDPKPLNPAKQIAGISDLLRRALGETIDLEIVGAGGLWLAEADPAELESAVLNLALNARDAMREGGKLTIETGNTYLDENYVKAGNDVTPGQYVMIAVSDTGTGMAKEIAEKAFEPFFTTKESGQGTGLGLSQVYGFVKQSGGHVKIYSEPGLGTSVKLYLPRSMARSEEASHKTEEIAGGSGHENILVVEDDSDVRDYVIETLRELNYNVMGAADANQALSIVASDRFNFDLLLTDVVLPGMNGRELADQIKQKRPGVPVLFMTGYSRNAIVHHGRLDPGVDLIQKPVTQEALAARVREMLDARRPRS